MFRSCIDRYLAREVILPATLGLLVFTLVLLMGRLVKLADLVINKGVALGDILALFAALVPSFLTISIPLAFLLGIMIGLGRMSADSETVALKAVGISLANLARPIMILALLCSLLTAVAGFWLEPWGYRAFKAKLFDITSKKASIGIQPRVFMSQFNNLTFYANDIDNRSGELQKLFIVERKNGETSLIVAERGNILSDRSEGSVTLQLHDGVIHRQGKNATDQSYQVIRFRNYEIQPDTMTAQTFSKSEKLKPKQLSLAELRERLKATETDPKQRAALGAEFHYRLCLPLAPIIFAMMGLPFSIHTQRSGRSGGFAFGLLIYLAYYLLVSVARTLSIETGVPAGPTLWSVHLILAGCGFYLLRQSSLERPIRLTLWIDQGIGWIKSFGRRDDHA